MDKPFWALSEHSIRVFTVSSGLNAVHSPRVTHGLSATWLAPLQQLEAVDKYFRLSRSPPSTNINSHLLLHFSFTWFSSELLSRNLSRLHFFLLFSPAPQCVSLYCFWIFPPFEFWFLPSVCALLPPFPRLLPFFGLCLYTFLCVSHWCSLSSFSLDVSFCFLILLTQSSTGFDLTIPFCSSVFLSLSHTHIFSNCLFPSGLPADQSWHVSQLSCRVTELLDSSQLSGWPISAQIHTF